MTMVQFKGDSRDSGTPFGKLPILFPYHGTHIFRDSYGNGGNSMGLKGSYPWGSLKIPLNSLGMVQGSLLSIALSWYHESKV